MPKYWVRWEEVIEADSSSKAATIALGLMYIPNELQIATLQEGRLYSSFDEFQFVSVALSEIHEHDDDIDGCCICGGEHCCCQCQYADEGDPIRGSAPHRRPTEDLRSDLLGG